MEQKAIIQRIKRVEENTLLKAQRYYTILSAIGGTNLTKREIQLIAFTAVKGNISYADYREEFNRIHNSSFATMNNIISKLKRLNILVKDNDKIKVNPSYLLNFEAPLIIQINLQNG